MPHTILEYTNNLHLSAQGLQTLFAELHQVLADTAGIAIENCKSRATALDVYHTGTGSAEQAFAHLEIRLLEGRSGAWKHELGRQCLEVLKAYLARLPDPLPLQVTLEVRDMQREGYLKERVEGRTMAEQSPPAQLAGQKPADIAPHIFRQRHMIEGYYTIEVSRDVVRGFLLALAAHLDLRTYGDPVVYAPAAGLGREENAGYDAFVPLVDSGISLYIWSQARFFSLLLYTCKGFDAKAAVAFTREFFAADGPVVDVAF